MERAIFSTFKGTICPHIPLLYDVLTISLADQKICCIDILTQSKFVMDLPITRILLISIKRRTNLLLQGDHSGCAKPPVDINTKVPL